MGNILCGATNNVQNNELIVKEALAIKENVTEEVIDDVNVVIEDMREVLEKLNEVIEYHINFTSKPIK